MTVFKTTASALALSILTAGMASAQVSAAADVGATSNVGADVSASASGDISSDALEGTRNTLNRVGDLGKSAVKATGDAIGSVAKVTGDAAGAVATTAGKVGADAIFNVETAFEAGTTQVTSTDGVKVGQVVGVRMVENGGQMVTLDLDDAQGFATDRVSISSKYFSKGDGVIGVKMSQAELAAQVNSAVEAKADS